MTISDDTIALAIPSALKSDHPDSALVVQALAVALVACEDSGAMTAKGRMRDVHAALSSVYVPIFQAHIAKEDEDWSALKAKADKLSLLPPVISVFSGNSWKGGDRFTAKGRTETGEVFEFYVWYAGEESSPDTRATMDKEDSDGSSDNVGSLRVPSKLPPKVAISTIAADNGYQVIFSGKAKERLEPSDPDQNAARERGDSVPSIDSQLAGRGK